uniref:DUF659 domain-containing protein n=1 Tax=Rhabditophanes sp. KR3021 TaxID=114890 RepID=A0AC35U2M9_9BILA
MIRQEHSKAFKELLNATNKFDDRSSPYNYTFNHDYAGKTNGSDRSSMQRPIMHFYPNSHSKDLSVGQWIKEEAREPIFCSVFDTTMNVAWIEYLIIRHLSNMNTETCDIPWEEDKVKIDELVAGTVNHVVSNLTRTHAFIYDGTDWRQYHTEGTKPVSQRAKRNILIEKYEGWASGLSGKELLDKFKEFAFTEKIHYPSFVYNYRKIIETSAVKAKERCERENQAKMFDNNKGYIGSSNQDSENRNCIYHIRAHRHFVECNHKHHPEMYQELIDSTSGIFQITIFEIGQLDTTACENILVEEL